MRPPLIVVPPAPSAAESDDLLGPVVPRSVVRRDRVLPILITVSLVVHATIMLPSLLRHGNAAPPPRQEIPIEIVQLPPKESPKPPEKTKPLEKTKPPEKSKVAEKPKPPEKKTEAKAEPPKPAPKPRKVAQKPPPKPAPKEVAAKQPPKPEPTPDRTDVADRMKDLLGSMPAIALPGVSGDGTEEASYAQLVLSKVAKVKKDGRYPGTPGAASVTFIIGDSGEIASVSLVRPSGERFLDEEAVAMIRRGAPYPPPPAGGRRSFTITLRFEPVV